MGETSLRLNSLRLSIVQMCSGINPDANFETTAALVKEAADDGAEIIVTPEMTTLLDLSSSRMQQHVHTLNDDPWLKAYRDLCRAQKVWLLLGSHPVLMDEGRLANRQFLINPLGQIVAHYDKAHMFDVDLADGESYRESKSYKPGECAVVVKTSMATFGMSICYDVRFAYLYRTLAQHGAQVIFVPAAFTQKTGELHWHVLLRARAIETGCYIVAPAQVGSHEDGRTTYGHALVVAPSGEILTDMGLGIGQLTLDISLDKVDTARQSVPSLTHDRKLGIVEIDGLGV